eukprot:scaffold13938_cov109-Isochrysis_galbana.AAC.8
MISCVVMLSASMRVTVRSPVSMASLLLSINSVVRAVSRARCAVAAVATGREGPRLEIYPALINKVLPQIVEVVYEAREIAMAR